MAKSRTFKQKKQMEWATEQAADPGHRLPVGKGQLNALVGEDVIAWVRSKALAGGKGYRPSDVVERALRKAMEEDL